MFQEDGSSSVTSSPLQMFPMTSLSPALTSPHPWLKELKPEERGLYLIHLLLNCASHVAAGNLESANMALDQISGLASPEGDTMQRIAAYFSEALADRILRSWPGVYKAFNSTRVPAAAAEEIAIRKMFFELLPFLKVASVISNQAVVEAMEGEKLVHLIDLNAAEPAQWCALIQDLSARPEGPPHLRITAVHHRREVLDQMAHVLSEAAENLDIPFQFNPVVVDGKVEKLDFEKLRVKTGEALAVSSVMHLHTLLACEDDPGRKCGGRSPSDDSGSSSPHSSLHSPGVESFLNAIWGLSPKLLVVTEQESDHNGRYLMERLSESLHFYAALFDCTESTLPRASLERLKVEKMVLGEEIKNIIACEGAERRERHEKLERWSQRLEGAGFVGVPLSYYALLQAKRLLQGYKCDGYKIRDENGSVVICWQDRPLYSVSAWRFRK